MSVNGAANNPNSVASHQGLQDGRLQGLAYPSMVDAVIGTAANVVYTVAQVLGGLITRAGNGAARTDTLPNAADLVAAINGAMVGSSFELVIRNNSATAVAITLAAGAGGTLDPAVTTIAQNNAKTYSFVFTSVTAGSEAYVCKSLGGGQYTG